MSSSLRSFLQAAVLCICVSAAVLCLCPQETFAENNAIYRWVDPVDKSIHYSQTPPADVTYEKVRIGTTAPPVTDAQERLKAMEKTVDEGIKTQELNAQKQKQAAAEAAKRKQDCQQAKDRLSLLETRPGKLLYKDKSGQMQRMTEERRQQNIAKFQEQIKTLCSPKR